jgi:hypothetical protein
VSSFWVSELSPKPNFAIHSESFEIMQPNTGEHLLDFLNEKSDFKGFHQRTLGYCYGHTTLQRKNLIILQFMI